MNLNRARTLLNRDSFIDGHSGTTLARTEPGIVSVHLNGVIAERLLNLRDWTVLRDDRGTRAFVAPDGERIWNIDEALRLALTAEAL